MNIDEAFPSKYLKVSDLKGRDVTVTMTEVRMEDVEETESKPVLYFQGAKKGMVLNKTNSENLKVLYGAETNVWIGKQVTIFTVETEFKGKPTHGLRLRAPGTAAPQTVSEQIAAGGGMQAPVAPVPGSAYVDPTAPITPSGGGPIDDDIPF